MTTPVNHDNGMLMLLTGYLAGSVASSPLRANIEVEVDSLGNYEQFFYVVMEDGLRMKVSVTLESSDGE